METAVDVQNKKYIDLLEIDYEPKTFWPPHQTLVTIKGKLGEVQVLLAAPPEDLFTLYVEELKKKLIEAGLISVPSSKEVVAFQEGYNGYGQEWMSFSSYDSKSPEEDEAYKRGWIQAAQDQLKNWQEEIA